MSTRNTAAQNQKSNKRALNACRACRQRKVKCSGAAPCQHCINRDDECLYDEAEKRVIVTERHLRNLERRATQSSEEDAIPPVDDSPIPLVSTSPRDLPLSPGPVTPPASAPPYPTTILGNATTHESSPAQTSKARLQNVFTWGLSSELRRLLAMPSSEDRRQGAFPRLPKPDLSSPVSALVPSRERVLQVVSAVDVHFKSQHGCSFPPKLVDQLTEAPNTFPACLNQAPRSWTAHLFVNLAFGSLLLARKPRSRGLPGLEFFVQSVRFLPSNLDLSEYHLEDVAVTNFLLALYAQSTGMLQAAYLHAGQALRLLRLIRSQSTMQSRTLKSETADMYNSVSTLDKRLAASIGLTGGSPLGQGTNIPQRHKDVDDSENRNYVTTFGLETHLALANILTQITQAVPIISQGGDIDSPDSAKAFRGRIHVPLTELQDLARHIRHSHQLCHHTSLSSISRTAATIHLAYCQCVMFALKPLLLFHIKSASQPGDTTLNELEPLDRHRLVRSCTNAAVHSLNILSALREQDYLEAFSPIDLEVTFTAAITLHMTTLLASSTKPCSFIDMAFSILKEMGQRGNIQASALADELSEIGNVLDNLSRSDKATIQIDTPLKVTDGLKLNDEILNILQMGQHKDSNDELQTREPPPGPAENATLVETAATVPTFDMLFDSTDTDWNFASEDLQWLDSVL